MMNEFMVDGRIVYSVKIHLCVTGKDRRDYWATGRPTWTLSLLLRVFAARVKVSPNCFYSFQINMSALNEQACPRALEPLSMLVGVLLGCVL